MVEEAVGCHHGERRPNRQAVAVEVAAGPCLQDTFAVDTAVNKSLVVVAAAAVAHDTVIAEVVHDIAVLAFVGMAQ